MQKAWMVCTLRPPGVSSAVANSRRARARTSASGVILEIRRISRSISSCVDCETSETPGSSGPWASDGITAIGIIRQELPATEIVALTSVLEDASVIGAVRAGAIGYLLKDTRADDLIKAIKAAAAGQVQLSPRAAQRLLREVRAPETAAEVLSPRETEVLRLLAGGRSNKEMARELAIGEKTIKTHVSRILAKLGVQSRTQAALYASRIGLIPVQELGSDSRG